MKALEGVASPGWILIGVCLLGLCIGWVAIRWMQGRRLLEGFQTAAATSVPLPNPDENAPKLTENEALAYDMLVVARLASCPDFVQTDTNMEDTDTVKDKTAKFVAYLQANSAAIKGRFWDYVSRLKPDEELPAGSPPSMLPAIRTVINPQPDDTYQVIFPLYMSTYALAIFGQGSKGEYKASCARVALFDYYMLIQKAISETVYDSALVAKWGVSPKDQSCASLQVAEGNLQEALNVLRTRVQDVSGMTFTLGNLRDENLDFQRRFEQVCKDPVSLSCKELASQEPILFPLLAEFEGVSMKGYEKEDDMNDVIGTIGKLYSILGCKNISGIPFTFSMDANGGELDAETLRMKLQTLSPYYISPDTMRYITDALISPDDVQDELMKTSDIFAKVDGNVGGIKRMSGLAA